MPDTPSKRTTTDTAAKTVPGGVDLDVTASAASATDENTELRVSDDIEFTEEEPSTDETFADEETLDDEPSTAIVPAAKKQPVLGGPAGDLLQRYMNEVNRYPLLTREEELELARRYRATGDPKLAYQLVTANLRLVVKIAWGYRRAAFDLLDLIQEGNLGLVQGVKKFDPDRGVKLSSYSAWWIRAYIIRHLMDNWRLVKLGTTTAQRKLFFNLRKEKEKLAAQGFDPGPRLLAERLDVTEQDVIEMDRRLSGADLSLDTPVSGESTLTIGDRLETDGEDISDRLADEELAHAFRQQLALFAETLNERERFIFDNRLVNEEPMTLQEIGDHFGFSRERARQVEARLTKRLKDYMKEALPGFADLSLESPEE